MDESLDRHARTALAAEFSVLSGRVGEASAELEDAIVRGEPWRERVDELEAALEELEDGLENYLPRTER